MKITNKIDKVEKMFMSGKDIGQISRELGLTKTTVYAYLSRSPKKPLKTKNKQVKLDKHNEIIRLVKSGLYVDEVSNRSGVTMQMVLTLAGRYGIKVKKRPRKLIARHLLMRRGLAHNQRSFAILACLINTDASIVEIAKAYGVSRQRVSQIAAVANSVGIKLKRGQGG